MIQDGVTIILVSHDIHLIENLCTKVIWLDHGCVKEIGETQKVCEMYEHAI